MMDVVLPCSASSPFPYFGRSHLQVQVRFEEQRHIPSHPIHRLTPRTFTAHQDALHSLAYCYRLLPTLIHLSPIKHAL